MISKQLREDLELIINETPIFTLPPEVRDKQRRNAKRLWGLYGSQKRRAPRGPWEKGYHMPEQYPKDYMSKVREELERIS